jgi:hypothetical protein
MSGNNYVLIFTNSSTTLSGIGKKSAGTVFWANCYLPSRRTMVLKDSKPQLKPQVHTWSQNQGTKGSCFRYRSALSFQCLYFCLSLLHSSSDSRSIVLVADRKSWAFSDWASWALKCSNSLKVIVKSRGKRRSSRRRWSSFWGTEQSLLHG